MPPTARPKPRRKPLNGMVAFIEQAIRNTKSTGAVLPSSRALALAMTRSLREVSKPKRVLEVGPGTGPFTKEILKSLRTSDEFHVVEINPAFAHRLDEVMLQPYRRRHPKVSVMLHIDAIQDAPLEGTFDYIVCGLPFNNFPPKLVRAIFRRMMQLLGPGGELTYFEYAGVRAFKSPFLEKRGREDLKRIGATGKSLRRKHQGKRELVLNNVPPAVAVHLTRE